MKGEVKVERHKKTSRGEQRSKLKDTKQREEENNNLHAEMNHRCLLLLCILVPACTSSDKDSPLDGNEDIVFAEGGGFGSGSGSGMLTINVNYLIIL